MSERSFRGRLAQIADMIDLEQLDGLVIRRDSIPMEEDQPRLHRLFMGLEQQENQNHQQQPQNNMAADMRQEEVDVVFAPIPDFWSEYCLCFPNMYFYSS